MTTSTGVSPIVMEVLRSGPTFSSTSVTVLPVWRMAAEADVRVDPGVEAVGHEDRQLAGAHVDLDGLGGGARGGGDEPVEVEDGIPGSELVGRRADGGHRAPGAVTDAVAVGHLGAR